MKLIDRLIYDILYNILKGFLLIFLFPLFSRIINWDYPQFIERISVRDWMLFYILILLSAAYIFYHRRKRTIEERNLERKTAERRFALHGEEKIGNLKYKDVFWDLLIPKEAPILKLSLSSGTDFFSKPSTKERIIKLKPGDIEVNGPTCPKCHAELEESETFFGRHLWECSECEFKKKNKYSCDYEWKKATLEARKEFKEFVKSRKTGNLQLSSVYTE